MITAHKALILLGMRLGYTDQEKGLCHGVTSRFLEACLLGEQEKFIRRINIIAQTKNLDVLIKEAKEKVKRNYSPLLSTTRITGVNEITTLASHL